MSKLKNASITNHEASVRELRADPEYAAEFVKVALEEMEDPETCATALLALRAVADGLRPTAWQRWRKTLAFSARACTEPSPLAATRR